MHLRRTGSDRGNERRRLQGRFEPQGGNSVVPNVLESPGADYGRHVPAFDPMQDRGITPGLQALDQEVDRRLLAWARRIVDDDGVIAMRTGFDQLPASDARKGWRSDRPVDQQQLEGLRLDGGIPLILDRIEAERFQRAQAVIA